MRKFDSSFRTDLRKTVQAIENVSGIEMVVAVLPRAKSYAPYYWGTATALAFVVLTVLMFIPIEFWYVLIYFETIGIAAMGVGTLLLFPALLRLMVGKKRLEGACLEKANYIFQKAKIYETHERIGILLVFSWFEQKVCLIADRGANALIPADELQAFETQCQAVFTAGDPATALLEILKSHAEMLAKYVPVELHPVNELPNGLWTE